MIGTEFAQRVLAYIASRTARDGACQVWTGAIGADGYGQIRIVGANWLVHRLAWMLRHGPISDGLVVMHSCDNRRCIREDHLSLGTRADNNADRDAKGRSRGGNLSGEDNPQAILLAGDVRAIFDSKKKLSVLARHYGVSISTISKIRRGESWQRVTGPHQQEVPA